VTEEETIRRLAKALSLRSEETGAHIRRVGGYASMLVTRMTPPVPWSPEGMFYAAMLHDVGKIGVPDEVLLKPGPLDEAEWALICQHPGLGHSLLADAKSPILLLGASIALTHHERWDGTGYPRGLAGTAIPLAGRVAAIADVFDALTSHRVYRPAMTFHQAAELMVRERGVHFDPELLDLFLLDLEEARKIRETHPDAVSAPGPPGAGLVPDRGM
jgi:putative two-component system response regulator